MLVVAPNGVVNAAKLIGAVTVSVELPELAPNVTETGETLQAANGADPFTVQLRFTCPEKPFCAVSVNASVPCAPVCSVRDGDAGAKVKSGAGANVAVTDWAEFMTMVQVFGSVPVQAPLQAEKTELAEGAAVRDTDVPCG